MGENCMYSKVQHVRNLNIKKKKKPSVHTCCLLVYIMQHLGDG